MLFDSDGVVIDQPLVRTRFNYDADLVSEATGICCPEETKAQQQFKDETDINTIVRKFGLTGQLPDNVTMPTYVDYEGIFDFQTAMNAVLQAEEAFMAMPADVRTRFGNDPQAFLEFCGDDKNRDEAIRLGLVPSPLVVAPPLASDASSEPVKGDS